MEQVWLDERGDVLTVWSTPPRNDCRGETELTWAPRRYWEGKGGEVRRFRVPTQVVRVVVPTVDGFVLKPTGACGGPGSVKHLPFMVGPRGRVHELTLSAATPDRRDGQVLVECVLPRPRPHWRSCVFDPPTGTLGPGSGTFSWSGVWDDRRSFVHRATLGIQLSWSADRGSTWNELPDTWDASPVRWDGRLRIVSNGRGRDIWEFADGRPVQGSAQRLLPPQGRGYRTWQVSRSGILIGINERSGAVDASTDDTWTSFRRILQPDDRSGPRLAGDLLYWLEDRSLVITADFGKTVVPIPVDNLRNGG